MIELITFIGFAFFLLEATAQMIWGIINREPEWIMLHGLEILFLLFLMIK